MLVAPDPARAGLPRRDQRMASRVPVRERVGVRRILATADVAAHEADPELGPLRANREAVLATIGARGHLLDALRVLARRAHDFRASSAARRSRLSFGQ